MPALCAATTTQPSPTRPITTTAAALPMAHPCRRRSGARAASTPLTESSRNSSSAILTSDACCGAAREIFPQAAADQPFNRLRHAFGDVRERPRFEVDHRRQRGRRRVATKRALARQHLVENRAEGKDVRPRVDLLAFRLFGRHVGDGAENRALPVSMAGLHARLVADSRRGRLRRSLASPKSRILITTLVGHHDVAGLEIAMDDAGRVGGGERIGDLDAVAQRIGQRAALRSESVCRAFAASTSSIAMILGPVGRPDVVDGDDVRVIERRGELGFLHEPAAALLVGDQAGRQNLERDRRPRRASCAS